MMPSANSSTSLLLERAFALMQRGKREEARWAVEKLLKQRPHLVQARALQNRIDNEEFSFRLFRYRPDMFEDENVSPLLLLGMLAIGIVFLIVGTWLIFQRFPIGVAQGFTTEIQVKASAVLPWTTRIPAHLLFLLPTALYIMGGMALYGYRRYTRP